MEATTPPQGDLICFSHLRWDFVFQRPQHVMTRWAREHRVFFVEEPRPAERAPSLELRPAGDKLWVVVPRLPSELNEDEAEETVASLLRWLVRGEGVHDPVLWYYTPMMLPCSRDLPASCVVYDCMDELSAFDHAPPALLAHERELLERADVVLTGGYNLYTHKRRFHPNVYPFPSSVDVAHFAAARRPQDDPPDQAPIPRPRLGWFGVIDERMDLALVDGVAAARPDWQLVMLGPVVKIDPAALPRRPNIHWLGMKAYDELPAYLSGWDVAMLPFARNRSTRYISPTKTPEYLAGGVPVVSTSIVDVVRPYGELGLASIADTADEFVSAVEALLPIDRPGFRARADVYLADLSWDRTWERMREVVEASARRLQMASK